MTRAAHLVSRLAHEASPLALARSLFRQRFLLQQLTRRELLTRYRGSVAGLSWVVLQPLLMLAVYAFVFGVVFPARFGGSGDSDFLAMVFVGLVVFNIFAETVQRAPLLMVSNQSYVKRVVFPLHVLPLVTELVALVHGAVALAILGAYLVWSQGGVPLTALALPLVLAPFLLVTAGLAFVLASLGTFVRDVAPLTVMATTMLLFLSPIFYPVAALPPAVQPLMQLNPLTFAIEQTRQILVVGAWPDWRGLLAYSMSAAVLGWLGYAWFTLTRKGFADVL